MAASLYKYTRVVMTVKLRRACFLTSKAPQYLVVLVIINTLFLPCFQAVFFMDSAAS